MMPALLVQKVDNTIHWVNLYIQWIAQLASLRLILIHSDCEVIYLKDSTISF